MAARRLDYTKACLYYKKLTELRHCFNRVSHKVNIFTSNTKYPRQHTTMYGLGYASNGLVLPLCCELQLFIMSLHAVCHICASIQASQLCTRARAKKVIAGLTVVALVIGCAISHYSFMYVTIMVLYIALYAVLPVTVLVKSFMSTTALLLMF